MGWYPLGWKGEIVSPKNDACSSALLERQMVRSDPRSTTMYMHSRILSAPGCRHIRTADPPYMPFRPSSNAPRLSGTPRRGLCKLPAV
ncbi:hypothetical protein VTG60DRAFT_2339 [Thermothelomyces hinnuleus]